MRVAISLADLGFDSWFQQRFNEYPNSDFSAARVVRVDRDRCLVRNEFGESQAEPTGRLMFSIDSAQELPCAGDWVLVQYHNDGTLAIIHDLLPRRTFLRRKSPGKNIDYQMIAANIDIAFIIQSCDLDFNIRRLERYLVMTNEGHIEPVILLSKSDLLNAGELEKRIAAINDAHIKFPVIPFSVYNPHEIDAMEKILCKGKTYCLLGSSGVGKTTLLNHLLGREEFETTPVRDKDGRGRHTTARRQLSILENGALLIDTPGLRELGMLGVEANVESSFSDIQKLSERCRFNDCSHTSESGCAILQAIGTGELDEDRYRSYVKLKKESEFHQLSYIERRQKDRDFGRMVNKMMKIIKKKGKHG